MATTLDRNDGTPARSLFLVELRAAIGVPTDLGGMSRDLAAAVARLREGGVAIDSPDSVFLPEDSRCLCLVRAVNKSSVALACDAAGLTAAPVYDVHTLSGGSWPTGRHQTDSPALPAGGAHDLE